jgi:CrcB protein
MIDPQSAILIALAGGLGAVVRLWLGKFRGRLPWGTLTANVVAGLALGIAVGLQNHALVPDLLSAVLFVGFAGGLSTFSGVAAETGELIRLKHWALALANLGANLLLPVLTVWLPVLAVALLVN